jgi:hypothetical protein
MQKISEKCYCLNTNPDMRIFIICSKKFYNRVPEIQEQLESAGHRVSLPNHYDEPETEERYLKLGAQEHAKWKAEMFRHSIEDIGENDAVLVLNFEKNGIPNYIGGATFLEMYDASRLGKAIYLFNEIPEGILRDEILGFGPIVINGDLDTIR